jgi:hypothetical protein
MQSTQFRRRVREEFHRLFDRPQEARKVLPDALARTDAELATTLRRLLWQADAQRQIDARGDDAPDLAGHVVAGRLCLIRLWAQQAAKVGADYRLWKRLSVGGDFIASSGQYLRSDETNHLRKTPGHAVFNLRAVYAFDEHFSIFGRIDNVFDREYSTFGVLGEPDEVFPDFEDPRFYGPAQPRATWVGVRVSL